ncbi:hypothetical protein [Parathalassolituus penaei]|uniref:Uncharacterized protein n=1 Tax=Parathalassolituus penaei TaxID=2997323 RepID=A0A9X3EDG1_9GAMM|nr:hypothetical protein [Parathalassolituus penaei]MCY0965175.1 hypothetical protein [Parathalassolituus penaei]
MTAQAYALVEYDGRIYCSERYEDSWESVKLQGSIGTRLSWSEALDELNNRIGSEKALADLALHLMVDDQSPATLLAISHKLESLNANKINLYPIRWMLASYWNGDAPDSDVINQILLEQVNNPGTGLVSTSLPNSSSGPDSVSKVAELEAYCKQLKTELAAQKRQLNTLQKDNESLKSRLVNLPLMLSDEVVNSYLACIFNNYWGNVSMDDHCIHTRQINRPLLVSPVTEPSIKVISSIATEIYRLPLDQRLALQGLCLSLIKTNGSLKTRHEFDFLLDDPKSQVMGDY